MVEFVGDSLISDYRNMQQNNTTDIASIEADLAYQVSRGVLSPEVVEAIRNSGLGQDANMKLALQDFDRDRAEEADKLSGRANSLGSGPYSRLGSPMNLTGPMQNDADAQAGKGLAFGTGVGPTQVNLPSPVNETNQILNSEDTMFGANPTALQQQIDPDTYARELNQPYFSGPIATPGIDYNTQNVSIPGNTGPNNIDYDMTSFYESPVNYDMTSFYESPNAVAGINTVQGVEDVQKNNSTSIIDSIVDSVMSIGKSGPVGTAYSMINNPSFPNQAIPGALAMAGGFSTIPGGGILGLLGGALNAMGAYHDFGSDPNVGQVSYQNGLLSAPTSAPGGYIYQDGYLSNLNSLNSMNPNTAINVGGGNGYATAGDLYQGLAQTGAGVRGEDYDRQTSFGGDGDAGNSAQESYDSWAESDN